MGKRKLLLTHFEDKLKVGYSRLVVQGDSES